MTRLVMNTSIAAENNRRASILRQRMSERGTLVVNLLSSPGAGKTTLLQATALHLAGRPRMATLVGDIATDRDAQRLRPWMPTIQLTTGGACHLDLSLVESGIDQLDQVGPIDMLFIENVGNLVCPASFDLGEHVRVVLLAVTEGDDKPQKYPKAFRTADVCLLTKIDLLPYVPFSIEAAKTDARAIRPDLPIFEVAATRGEGLEAWSGFLESSRLRLLEGAAR